MSHPSDPDDTARGPGGDGAHGQQGYGQQGYGGQQHGDQSYGGQQWGSGGPGYQTSPKNGLGVAALVLGILGLLTFWTVIGGILLGIVAVVLGIIGRGRAKKGVATNGGVALAGIITGALAVLVTIAAIALGAAAIFSNPDARDLISCISDAGGDQAAIEQCNQEFSDQLGVPTT